ncbi:fructoselysine-6-P-deglycase FrlB-like protein [Microbacteriaceae bacterium SG_E_30_P1]|uniref:Glutamine--fructose-6-phosphate aminotransferase [isomerizing] n=1 Tax=Antiquaquibacter oligotrophicus TaxID=2880260 RepID=A0ABT6KQ99_9MICO|nr:SIS domain-containing protein [Antiquaquibacter oligotrophicus]MDH6182144.1 fructoselysine-6-P-deglycase FrlB-like protein [Antiquaquibacter oligotrophicus]UDF12193.1 SIS domain-containing protein [Antiquaquibacter oligotrophicus]
MVDGYIAYASARATQADALEAAIPRISGEVLALRESGGLTGPGPIFVGIGASLAAACAPVWELRQRGVHSWRLGAGDHPLPFPASVHPIIGISQSGKSTETLAVLESVDPTLRYAVVNAQPSPVSTISTRTLSLGNIPDSYASTIGYTATITGLGMIADAWDGGEIDSRWVELPDLFRWTEQTVGARAGELAATFAGAATADFVGAGPSVGSAEAGALLFREVARVHAAGMSTRQYLHGSMESAGDGVHVLFGEERELDLARMLAGAGHRVILISTAAVPEETNLQTVQLPLVGPAQHAILEALVMQILVGEVAIQHGIDVEEFVFHHNDTKVEGTA